MSRTIHTSEDRRQQSLLSQTLGSVIHPQTYRNLLYLLLAFPFGILYFVLLTTGLALGIGLVITLLGIPLLIAVVVGSRRLASFERGLANDLLGLTIQPPDDVDTGAEEDIWPRARTCLLARSTWMGLCYLFVKLPIGIASFALVVTGLTLSFGLLTAPLTYSRVEPGLQLGVWTIDTFPEAIVAVPIGIVTLGATAYVFNQAARLFGRITTVFLGVS
ncbi:sensor domain-containing protein [Halobaculum magnesiiphilum]|uniref:Sensor domain-containing protein n=1 Tax=Halobaculum magnesiiphilum TaxID=1017351 RepID=A0A8T8WIQ7_9EURY|nr:sensor domain-containing protein [Halobaculum magnesiiphilum]QZP39614.1 sensor domain-containing protein [Halobaculum magnesiiphilum]